MKIGTELRKCLRKTLQPVSYKHSGLRVLLVLATAAMVGCEGEEIDDADVSGLEISLADYRYGTQQVGSRTPQVFEISNVGVDTYPINSISVGGEHAADFELMDFPETTLEPGDQMEILVSFSPVGAGPRTGSLDLDFDVISGFGSNTVEAIYYSARTAEDSGDTVGAAFEYRRYLAGGNTTDNRSRAIIKATLFEEADVYGTGSDFSIYREAINQRDSGNIEGAIESFQVLLEDFPDSYLADDSQYMIAYINLVDLNDYEAAFNGMQTLLDSQPDSSYVDTALYSQGIALSELGNSDEAEEIFISLKDRHTGIRLDLFELSFPKDNYVSRLWYEKADEQIDEIAVRVESYDVDGR